MKLEPMRYASGIVEERAGTTLPNTSIIIYTGSDKRISSGMMAGKKGNFTVVQRLWRLEGASGVQASTKYVFNPPSKTLRKMEY